MIRSRRCGHAVDRPGTVSENASQDMSSGAPYENPNASRADAPFVDESVSLKQGSAGSSLGGRGALPTNLSITRLAETLSRSPHNSFENHRARTSVMRRESQTSCHNHGYALSMVTLQSKAFSPARYPAHRPSRDSARDRLLYPYHHGLCRTPPIMLSNRRVLIDRDDIVQVVFLF